MNITNPYMINEISKNLWEHSMVGLAIVEEDGTFLSVNPALCKIVGYSEYELQQKKWQEITHPSDINADNKMSEQVILNNDTNSYEMSKRYITKTGNIVWVLLKVVKITKEDGSFAFFLSQVSEVLEISPPTSPTIKKKYKKSFWNFIKDYSSVILAILTAIGIIISQIIKN